VTACHCQFCARKLEPAQALRFLVETDTLYDPVHLSRIRRLPFTADGRPLRVCGACQTQIEARPVQFRAAVERVHVRRQLRAGMVAAVGLLSVGWLLGTFLGAAGLVAVTAASRAQH
jgi:hypothetical protein